MIEWLKPLAGGERPLGSIEFNEAWDQWYKLRALDQKIDGAWADVERLLDDEHDGPHRELHAAVAIVRGLVDEWEELMASEHPLGRISRMRQA